ncbi:TY-Chap domain-containing protein [Methylobacterium trifolii]|uniref:TY-Chap N-terminal domain-containing protein n=1 Tax=Methylobacterium trifolii TaxID=1003092 RepID=A0ABQ4U4V7_9HYPH|nr:hypothetical protein [Methylobacterium trifolii]GJE61939.1 hypothetical protein MPOCJGCO_4067 [Methylobacterium trifolii]
MSRGRMRLPWRTAIALAALAASPPSWAGDARDRFVATHHCEILSRLWRIYDRGPHDTSKDRFLAVTLAGRPQSYVQCIFTDDDARMLCEAASGAYRGRDDPDRGVALPAESIAALRRLGFEQPDRKGNFEMTVDLGSPPRLDDVARLMLVALHDAYGGDAASVLELTAPMARYPGRTCGLAQMRVNARPGTPAPPR